MKTVIKQTILLLILAFYISCEKEKKIKEIEILTYFNNGRNFSTYSSIDEDGISKTLYKSKTSDSIDYYQSAIRKGSIDSIYSLLKNKNLTELKFKPSKGILYDGHLKSIQITFEDDEQLKIQYAYINESNEHHKIFESILNQIRNDSLNGKRHFNDRLGYLYLKQQEISEFTFKHDSIKYSQYRKSN